MTIQKPIEVADAFQFSKILLWTKSVTIVTRRVHIRPLVLSVLFTLRRQDSWCFPLNIEFNWCIVVRVAYRCKASLLLSLLLSYALPPLTYMVLALEFYLPLRFCQQAVIYLETIALTSSFLFGKQTYLTHLICPWCTTWHKCSTMPSCFCLAPEPWICCSGIP